MNENAELEPRFIVTVTLDGDDYPEAAREIARERLETGLRLMEEDGVIRAYTIERAP